MGVIDGQFVLRQIIFFIVYWVIGISWMSLFLKEVTISFFQIIELKYWALNFHIKEHFFHMNTHPFNFLPVIFSFYLGILFSYIFRTICNHFCFIWRNIFPIAIHVSIFCLQGTLSLNVCHYTCFLLTIF